MYLHYSIIKSHLSQRGAGPPGVLEIRNNNIITCNVVTLQHYKVAPLAGRCWSAGRVGDTDTLFTIIRYIIYHYKNRTSRRAVLARRAMADSSDESGERERERLPPAHHHYISFYTI